MSRLSLAGTMSLLIIVTLVSYFAAISASAQDRRKIGVIYMVHGGSEASAPGALWESTIQIFSHDPNNSIFKRVIWNPEAWPMVSNFGDGQRYANVRGQRRKYAFQNERIGGIDPARRITISQFEQMTEMLEAQEEALNVDFITDWASWITDRGDTAHYPYPRFLYGPQVEGGAPLTYCGSEADGDVGPDGTWPDCDPQRYNVDGPAERLLKQGAEELILIDMTTSGVRFVKTYEIVEMLKMAVRDYTAETGQTIPVRWANDPTDLMHESHPTKPEGWTRSLGTPEVDPKVPLEGRPNPVSDDPELATLMVDGIAKQFSPDVPLDKTAVFIINHSVSRHNQTFDPKVDDTLVLNDNIKADLMARYPDLKPDWIIGGWMGIKEENPNLSEERDDDAEGERTRRMRGENLGHAYLYESDMVMPTGTWGWLYWDGLEFLKDEGAEHVVVIFSQIVTDSVLNLVEVHNQVAKEIGYKTWLHWDEKDFEQYPEVGHPFADYWGIWAETMCRRIDADPGNAEEEPCCFEMGGCKDTRQPYPPLRQTPIDQARGDLDPSLVFDVSAYGHLGYDPAKGPPSDDAPVQDQYTGTWALWDPPNDDPRLSAFLADKVIELVNQPQE